VAKSASSKRFVAFPVSSEARFRDGKTPISALTGSSATTLHPPYPGRNAGSWIGLPSWRPQWYAMRRSRRNDGAVSAA